MNFKTTEEYIAARQKFFESHPEAHEAKDVECLDLVMKKVYARQIIAGTKKLEFRSYSPFYVSRLIDKAVAGYIKANIDDEEVLTFCNDIRQVKKIHFHDYNKSWFLDVECTFNDAFCINRDDIAFLQKKYGCHDWDQELAYYESAGIEERPYVFYLVCGRVIATNLR